MNQDKDEFSEVFGDEQSESDEYEIFYEQIEEKGAEAFKNLPPDLYSLKNRFLLLNLCELGYVKEVVTHAPEELKNDHQFLNSIIPKFISEPQHFREVLNEDGDLAFYQIDSYLINNKNFLLDLVEYGFYEKIMPHIPFSLKADSAFMEEIENATVLNKYVIVEKILYEEHTPDDGFYNLWGQKESYQRYQANLIIDGKTLFFEKNVQFMPMHDSDEEIITIDFSLNQQIIATCVIAFDEEVTIHNPSIFELLRVFQLNKLQIPEITSFDINLFKRDWDSILSMTNTLGNKPLAYN